MPLTPPSYVPVESIARPQIRHKWDDFDPYEPLAWPDENTKTRLATVSNHGITAFAIGCAEWVVYRLSPPSSDQTPFDYLEAFWVYVMGHPRALPPETEHEQWTGPIRGPMNLALMTVLNTVYLSEDGPAIQNGALAAQIALHVLEDHSAFLSWQGLVLSRLGEHAARDEENPDGPPLPREILDPSVSMTDFKTGDAIDAFVRRAVEGGNPFLSRLRPS
jgi:hypothetical protein